MTAFDLLPGLERGARSRRARAVLVAALATTLAGAVVLVAITGRDRERARRAIAQVGAERAAAGSPSAPALATAALDAHPVAARGRHSRASRPRLTDLLHDIAAEADRGLVVAAGLDADVTGSFPDGTPWERRLEALSRVHGLSYHIGAAAIEVSPLEPEPTPAPAPPPAAGAIPARPVAGSHAAGAAGSVAAYEVAEPIATRVLHVANARATEIARVISDGLRATSVSVAADAASNALVVSGPRSAVAMVEGVVARLDVVRRRFLLDAMILEMASSTRTELGVQWRIESANLGAFVDFPREDDGEGDEAGIVVASSGSHNLRARISALEADGRIHVVSRPSIVVVEGKPASIESVRVLRVRFPDRAAVVSSSDDVAPTGDRAVEAIPVGVRLRVEPALQGASDIVLRIRAESSNLGQPLPPDDIPEELSRVVDAEVVVADGETAVLGGLLQVTRGRSGAGLPYLRRVPLVGLLFGRRRVEREGQELLVLVTPRLLGPAAVPRGSR